MALTPKTLQADQLDAEISAAEAKKASALHEPLHRPLQVRSLSEALHERLSDEELMALIDVDNLDPLSIPPELIPEGWIYQWFTKEVYGAPSQAPVGRVLDGERTGWQPVRASRHPGRWHPSDYEGVIEHAGLVLMELPDPAAYNRYRALYLLARNAKKGAMDSLYQAPQGTGPRTHPGVRPQVNITREPMKVE